MAKNYVDLLVELYEITKGTALGGVLLETVGGAQQHGHMTVRLGTNADRTYSLYCHDRTTGQAVTQFLIQRAIPRLYIMPDLPVADFRTMVRNPDVAIALGGEAPDDVAIERWPRLSAMAYLRRSVTKLRASGQPDEADKLVDKLAEPLCALSEARFRTLLNELLGWKADELDVAVEEVLSWTQPGQPQS